VKPNSQLALVCSDLNNDLLKVCWRVVVQASPGAGQGGAEHHSHRSPILYTQQPALLCVSIVVSAPLKSVRLCLPGEHCVTKRPDKFLFSASGWEWNVSSFSGFTVIEIPVPSSSTGLHTFLTDLLRKVLLSAVSG
jgi:hypothetical protein